MPEPIEDGVDQSSDGSEQPCVADLVGTQGMGKFVGHLHWRHDHTEQQQARDGVEEIEPTDGTQVGLNAEGTRSGCSFSAHVASGQSSVSGASRRIGGAQSEPLLNLPPKYRPNLVVAPGDRMRPIVVATAADRGYLPLALVVAGSIQRTH